MDWDKLRVFHAVADAGSFTHAGEKLNLSQSAVSRQISALEESLNVPLFHRHARGLLLTEQGELLHRTARDVFSKLSMVETQLQESREKAQGPLRITTTVAFGSTWLTPRVREFLTQYPEIELALLIDDSEVDLAMRHADAAIRFTPPRQPDLIQRHLTTVALNVYGSVDYLKRRGIPHTLDELANHDLIIFGYASKPPADNINWLVEIGNPAPGTRKVIFEVNNQYAIYQAVCSGLGLAAIPDFMIGQNQQLVRVLPDLSGPTAEAFFVYAEELKHSKRIAVFRDFLIRKMQEARFAS